MAVTDLLLKFMECKVRTQRAGICMQADGIAECICIQNAVQRHTHRNTVRNNFDISCMKSLFQTKRIQNLTQLFRLKRFQKIVGGIYVVAFHRKFTAGSHKNKNAVIRLISDSSGCFHAGNAIHIDIQKQDLEKRFWDLSNGGKIQYVKYPIDYNLDAIRTLVRRAMKLGFYEGVNLSLAYCDDCGHQELEMDVCPKCGSSNLTKIDRMNGYLSYSRVKGDTRLNEAKMAEIAERKSM